jgi:hypothetical protein
MSTNQKFAKAKYLIYSKFETKTKNGGTICGSLYLNYYPNTEEEAKMMIEYEKNKYLRINEKYVSLNSVRYYGYHLNNPEWWDREN